MKKNIIIIWAIMFCLLSIFSFGQTKKWTILVYMNADNNLEQFGIQDINEMEKVGSDANINIVVQVDRHSGYDTSNGNWTGTRRYYITQDNNTSIINSTLIQDMGELDMGDPVNLTNFFKWGIQNYPAEKYFMVMWNHGGGWTKGGKEVFKDFSNDETSGNGIGIANGEFYNAMIQVKNYLGRNIDIIGFDCCLMQMWEVEFEAQYFANYFVGSEELEGGAGWTYDGFLAPLKNNPNMSAEEVGRNVVIAYYNSGDSTQSLVNLQLLGGLSAAIDNFAVELSVSKQAGNGNNIVNAVRAADDFAASYGMQYIDLGHFANLIKSASWASPALVAAANQVLTKISEVVVLSKTNGADYANCKGISIYHPESVTGSGYSTAYNNLKSSINYRWDNYLKGENLSSSTDTTPPVISNVSANPGTTTATITWTTNEASTSKVIYGPNNTVVQNSSMVTSHTITLSGLTPNTTYSYKVYSTDAAGNEGSSSTLSFTTQNDGPTQIVISNVAVTNITATSATITWTTDVASTSEVIYGTTTSYGLTSGVNTSLVTNHTVTLTGLTANTTYNFKVKSTTSTLTKESANATFTTLQSNTNPTWVDAVQAISSPHNYTNNYDKTWTITHNGALKVKVYFSKFETEAKYDFVYIYDGNNNLIATYDGSKAAFWSAEVPGTTVKIRLKTDGSVTKYGFDITKSSYLIGSGNTASWKTEAYNLSSPSPYVNNYDNTWTITKAGAEKIKVYFSSFATEAGYDFVYIYDANGTEIAKYDGNKTAFWSAEVPGNTIKIRLKTDYSVTANGFVINQISYFSAKENLMVNNKPFELKQNYPNPFNPTTTIAYTINEKANVSLNIYDINGRLVKTLVNNEEKMIGEYTVRWDGDDNNGNKVSTGVYFYRLTAGDQVETKKMLMMK